MICIILNHRGADGSWSDAGEISAVLFMVCVIANTFTVIHVKVFGECIMTQVIVGIFGL